jgi:hypothetical protein
MPERLIMKRKDGTEATDYIGIIGGTGPAGTTPLPAVTEEYPRLICHN